jgi:hypothetical protein
MRISSPNTQLSNCSPVEPILTSNTLIDSVQLAETHRNRDNFPNVILGEQPGNSHKNTLVEHLFNRATDFDKKYTHRFNSTSGTQQKHKNFQNFILGERPGIFKQKLPQTCTLNRLTYFRRHYADCFNSTTSTEKLPPHHFCLVHRLRKTANIHGKLFSV